MYIIICMHIWTYLMHCSTRELVLSTNLCIQQYIQYWQGCFFLQSHGLPILLCLSIRQILASLSNFARSEQGEGVKMKTHRNYTHPLPFPLLFSLPISPSKSSLLTSSSQSSCVDDLGCIWFLRSDVNCLLHNTECTSVRRTGGRKGLLWWSVHVHTHIL